MKNSVIIVCYGCRRGVFSYGTVFDIDLICISTKVVMPFDISILINTKEKGAI
ncbi:MAG: hypothetical protein ACLFV2_06710 [Desulfurivibrionaceae bacterium]